MHILNFKPEVILGIYMAACIAVLVFNVGYIFWDIRKKKRLDSHKEDMVEDILAQINGIQPMDGLRKNLKKVENLRVFEYSLEQVKTQVSEGELEGYIKKLRPTFLELVVYYRKRDVIEKAYIASLIKNFHIDKGYPNYDGIMDFLVALVIGKDVYARENALGALFMIGNEDSVVAAWQKMQDNQIYHSAKLLTDGLLSFTGDRTKLAHTLFDGRSYYDTELIIPMMQFIRFYTGDFQEEFLNVMQGEEENKELRLEAIRYFRKHPFEPAKETLFKFLRYQEFLDWEYAAMAASSLEMFPGLETEEALKEGLHASNWYVRRNCAQALIYGLKVSQASLYDIYNGRDRYAREILRYVTQQQEIRDKEMRLEEVHV